MSDETGVDFLAEVGELPEAETGEETSTSEDESVEEETSTEETSEDEDTEEESSEDSEDAGDEEEETEEEEEEDSDSSEDDSESEDDDDELTSLKKRIELLQNRLEEVSKVEEPSGESNEVAEDFEKVFEKSLDGFESDGFIEDPVPVLKKVAKSAYDAATQNVLKSVPGMVTQYVSKMMTMKAKVDEFYNEHEDLAGAKKTVGMIANDLQQQNPEWSMDKVFVETAKKARKVLGLKEVVKKKGKATKGKKHTKKPALPKKKGGRKRPSKKRMNELEQQIAELID